MYTAHCHGKDGKYQLLLTMVAIAFTVRKVIFKQSEVIDFLLFLLPQLRP